MSGSTIPSAAYPGKPVKPSPVLLWVAAVFLLIYGSFFFIAFLGDLISGNYEGGKEDRKQTELVLKDSTGTQKKAKDTSLGVILAMGFVCGIIPLGLSGLCIVSIQRKKRRYGELMSTWLETSILKYASARDGRMTTQDVAVEFQIGFTDAKKHLDQLVIKGVAEILVSESGEMIYAVHGFGEDKSKAEKV